MLKQVFRKLTAVLLAASMTASLGLTVTAAPAGSPLSTSAITTPLPQFPDIAGHWGEAALIRWAGADVLCGDEQGRANPDQAMTRAEFAQFLVTLFGFTDKAENSFADVEEGAWYADAILKANAAGFLAGDGKNANPNSPITRQEAAVMLCQAFRLTRVESAPGFADDGDIAAWAKSAVATLAEREAIGGVGDNRFAPNDPVTRAAVAVMLDKMVSVYANTAGETVEGKQEGIVLVAAEGVKVSGSVADTLLLAPKAEASTLTLTTGADVQRLQVLAPGSKVVVSNGAKVQELVVSAENVTVQVNGSVASLTAEESASGLDVIVNRGGKVEKMVSYADALVLSGRGDVGSFTVESGKGVTVDRNTAVDKVTNNGSDDVTVAGKPLKPGASTSNKGGGSSVIVEPEEEDKLLSLNWNTYAMAAGYDNDHGETITLTADYDVSALEEPVLKWESEDPSIVSVTPDGQSATLRAHTTGWVDVTASLYDGETLVDTETCAITVVDNYDRATIMTLALSTQELVLHAGDAPAAITPIFYPMDFLEADKLDSTLEIVPGYDEKIIEVSISGGQIHVTPLSAGETTFTVRSVVNGRSTSCKVTVTGDDLSLSGLTAAGQEDLTLTVGESASLEVTPSGSEQPQLVWSSSNAYIASVDQQGVVTARSTSNYYERHADNTTNPAVSQEDFQAVTITATSVEGGYTAQFKVTVLPQDTLATSIAINKETINVALGGQEQYLTASVNPASILSPDVTWSSSDPDVVTAEPAEDTIFGAPQAKLVPHKAGTAVVTASYAGLEDTCTVTVTDGEVKISSISIQGSPVQRDQVVQFTAQVTQEATNQKLYWLSSNRYVATVNQEGYVQGYEPGEAVIYAIARDALSEEQLSDLDQVADLRNLSQEDTEGTLEQVLSALVPGQTYDTYSLTVESPSPYLRNLHAPAEAVTSTSVALLWNRDSLYAASELEGSEVFVNGVSVAQLDTEMGYTVKDLEPDTLYTFQVTTTFDGSQQVSESIQVRTKPAATKVLNVLEAPYNAVGDGSTLDTAAIQAAIDDCPAGGEVWLPAGHVFYSGALFLKSDMTLRVDGILLGSTDPKDYPRMVTRWEGWRKIYQPLDEWKQGEGTGLSFSVDNEYSHSSLLTLGVYDEGEDGYTGPFNIENVVICGSGQINGNGYQLGYNEGPNSAANGGPNGTSPKTDPTIRGRSITLHNAKNVYITDVMVANSPAWTIQIIYSDSVTLDNVSVVSLGNAETKVKGDRHYILNGDGCDVDSSTNTNIVNSFFRAGDDAIAAKSGKDNEGWHRAKPTAYLRITDVLGDTSRYGVIIGSEMAGGAHDMLVQNVEFKDNLSNQSLWIKAPPHRGGLVEDIVYRDVFNNSSKGAIWGAVKYSDGSSKCPAPVATRVRRLTYENVYDNNKSGASSFEGSSQSDTTIYIRDILIRGCTFNAVPTFTKVDGVRIEETTPYGYVDKGDVHNVVLYNSAVEQDTGIQPAKDAADVKETDLESGFVLVRLGTTAAQLKGQLIPAVAAPGEQSYSVAGRSDDDPLAEGDVLTVTAKDQTTTRNYTISYYRSADIPGSTEIELLPEGCITGIQASQEAKTMTLVQGATVQQLLGSFRSLLGGTLSCAVFQDLASAQGQGEPLPDSTQLSSGCCLRLVSQDGSGTEYYLIQMELPTVSFNMIGAELSAKSDSFSESDIIPDNKNGSDHYFQVNAQAGEYFQFSQPLTFAQASYTLQVSAKTGSNRGDFQVLLVSETGEELPVGEISMKSSGGLTTDTAVSVPAGTYYLKYICSGSGYFTGRSIEFIPQR